VEKIEETYIDKIQIKKSTLNKEFIGKKRELNDKLDKVDKTEHIYKEEKINKNISNKILYCFNCSWKFPERMSLVRKNIHINSCYEGKGKLDIMKYTEEQRLKIYKSYSNKKIVNMKICPICGKEMSTSNLKSKQCHLNTCIKTSLNYQ